MTNFIIVFDIVVLAYLVCILFVLLSVAKRQNIGATVLFFIALICNLPVVYTCFGRGGFRQSVWMEYFHDFNVEKIMIPAVGLVFFILGLCIIFFYTTKKTRNARETARMMKREGMDPALIAEITDLSLSEIERMK